MILWKATIRPPQKVTEQKDNIEVYYYTNEWPTINDVGEIIQKTLPQYGVLLGLGCLGEMRQIVGQHGCDKDIEIQEEKEKKRKELEAIISLIRDRVNKSRKFSMNCRRGILTTVDEQGMKKKHPTDGVTITIKINDGAGGSYDGIFADTL